MCGIAGFFAPGTDEQRKQEIIRAMGEKIHHRGPDGDGYYVDALCALAHKRLSIIDLEGGAQPMFSADKRKVVVFNGEIYNYQELKEELTEYPFSTTSDTEVLLAGYEKWGKDLPSHLRGMFAFALYDLDKEQIFLARDHFGIKPLYVYENDGLFMFASEIKAFFAHPDFTATLDESLISAYMTFSFTPSTNTFFKGVRRLDAGHTITIDKNLHREEKYFDLSYTIGKQMSDEEAAKEIATAMEDSVNHHMIADVEVGSFLSGGVDSSYLVTLAKPAKTFTVGYAEEKYSEIDNAKDLADKLGIQNTSKTITPDEYMDALDRILYHMDEPSSDPAIVSLYFLAQLAAQEVKVVLSGEGSDEFFGGYNTYHTLLEYGGYDKIPYPLRFAAAKLLQHTAPFKGRNFMVRRGLPLEDWYVGISRVYEDREIKRLTRVPVTKRAQAYTAPIFKETTEHIKFFRDKSSHDEEANDSQNNMYGTKVSSDDLKKATQLIQMQALDVRCWLVKDILQKADRMSMAHSLEARVPFTDREVFALASTLPFGAKLRGNTTKYALREAAHKVIPNESYARKKLGFPVPVREWMRKGRLYEEVKQALNSKTAEQFFDTKILMHMLEEHRTGRRDYYRKIWNVFIFIRWYDIFFGNRRAEYVGTGKA